MSRLMRVHRRQNRRGSGAREGKPNWKGGSSSGRICLAPRLLGLAALSLAYCAPPPPPTGQARADAATLTACREHADQVYDRNNRDTIYTITSRDSPFSANYTPGVTTRSLAQQYVRDNMVRDCVRNTGTETDRAPTTSPPPATP